MASWVSKQINNLRENYRKDKVNTITATIVILAALTWPWVIDPLMRLVLHFSMIDQMFPIIAYILLALGLNIVVGYAGLLDLGYAAFFAIGAYTIAILTSPRSPVAQFLSSNMPFLHVNFWFSLILAFFITAICGVILGAPTLRLRGDYLAIVTLGFGEIVPVIFLNAHSITYGEQGLNAIDQPVIFGFRLGSGPQSTIAWYYLLIAIGAILIFIARRLRDSRIGRAWMAMREDEIAATSMGIDLVRTKLLAFAMGASFSGFVGVMFASRYSFAAPSQFEFSTSVLLLCMVILGGMGNIWGVIVGGFLLGLFDRVLADKISEWGQTLGERTNWSSLLNLDLTKYRYLIFGLTLVIMMLLRPEGILPSAERMAELHEDEEAPEQLYDVRSETQSTGGSRS